MYKLASTNNFFGISTLANIHQIFVLPLITFSLPYAHERKTSFLHSAFILICIPTNQAFHTIEYESNHVKKSFRWISSKQSVKRNIKEYISTIKCTENYNIHSGVTEEEGALRHIWCGGPCWLMSLFDWDIIFILNVYWMFWKIPCPWRKQ